MLSLIVNLCIHIQDQRTQQKSCQDKYGSATELKDVVTIYENHSAKDKRL